MASESSLGMSNHHTQRAEKRVRPLSFFREQVGVEHLVRRAACRNGQRYERHCRKGRDLGQNQGLPGVGIAFSEPGNRGRSVRFSIDHSSTHATVSEPDCCLYPGGDFLFKCAGNTEVRSALLTAPLSKASLGPASRLACRSNSHQTPARLRPPNRQFDPRSLPLTSG